MIVWGGTNGPNFNTGGRYNPLTDSWVATSTTSVPAARDFHTAVWTGSEMIVWGGDVNATWVNTGGRYNPVTDTWSATATASAPSVRLGHTAVWTGSLMIIWGGQTGSSVNTGGRYDPSTNTWTATSLVNAPVARNHHTAVWTNTEMIIWGGTNFSSLDSMGRYNPGTDTWSTTLPSSGIPKARYDHTAVWTGSEMIVWGGIRWYSNFLNEGGKYNPSTNSWTDTSTFGAPSAREYHTAVWTGSQMIVWGGNGITGVVGTGGKYDPGANTWSSTPFSGNNIPAARTGHVTVWTGVEMIVWGGYASWFVDGGGRYNPATDTWSSTTLLDEPSPRSIPATVWTGTEMIIWGGHQSYRLGDGGRYNPLTDTWSATTMTGAPEARTAHTGVWTGTEMIIWGGQGGTDLLNSGAAYDPASDSWRDISASNAPSAREYHSAVWTGSEMIVWGGENGVSYKTGGRYNPSSDTWVSTSTTGAPDERIDGTAVWTGTEMIVWGGNGLYSYLNSGGRYNPATDSWLATSTVSAPNARAFHGAVWTGKEMIVWGGYSALRVEQSGGRYDPATDMWVSTTTSGAPAGVAVHSQVWTGTRMIVWGGGGLQFFSYDGGLYCASPPISAQIYANDVTVGEGDSGTANATFTLMLSAALDRDVTVQYQTTAGTANAAEDYLAVSGTATIPAGQTSATVLVPVKGDTSVESNEAFYLDLSSPVNAVIVRSRGIGVIYNDDGITLSVLDTSVTEKIDGVAQAIFTITANPPSGAAMSVDYSTQDGSAVSPDDYTTTTGTVIIPARAASVTVSVPILGDTVFEPIESFFLNLNNPVRATISDGQGVGYIHNAPEQWVHRFTDWNSVTPAAIAVDSSGDAFVAGITERYPSDYIFLIKYDPSGLPSSSWADVGFGTGVRAYEVPLYAQAFAMKVDSSNHIYIVGAAYYPNQNATDSIILKYDSTGELSSSWPDQGDGDGVRRYDSSYHSDDYLSALAVDSAGDLYATGYSYSDNRSDILTIRYDSNGDLSAAWPSTGFGQGVRRYEEPEDPYFSSEARAILIDDTGNVFIAGGVDSNYYGGRDFITIKYAPNGEYSTTWATTGRGDGIRIYDGLGHDYDEAVAEALDAEGNLHVAGTSPDVDYHSDYAILKYDSTGTLSSSWPDIGPGEGIRLYSQAPNMDNTLQSMVSDASGHIYVTGYTFGPPSYNMSYTTLKLDSDGTFSSSWPSNGYGDGVRVYNGPVSQGTDQPVGMGIDSSGNVTVTGFSNGTPYTTDYATVKYDSSGDPFPGWPDLGDGTGVRRYDSPEHGVDVAVAMAIDSQGNAFVTGYTGHTQTVTIKYSNGDIDADGVIDDADCNPGDSTVWSAPSAARNLRWPLPNAMTWTQPSIPGGTALTYDVLRSASPFNFSSASCVESGDTNTDAVDSTVPTPGQVFYYVIRVRNGCGSNMGTNSSGIPRTGRSCP